MIPDRLAQLFAQESLPWDQAEVWDVQEFLKAFTLHDSHWFGIQFDAAWDGDATAAIGFDPIWNKIGEAATSECGKWPTLFIRFPAVTRIEKEGYNDIGGIRRGIAEAVVSVLEGQSVRTVISDHYGGKLTFQHQRRISTLCYSHTGSLVKLKLFSNPTSK